jgi:hypothetical protein
VQMLEYDDCFHGSQPRHFVIRLDP